MPRNMFGDTVLRQNKNNEKKQDVCAMYVLRSCVYIYIYICVYIYRERERYATWISRHPCISSILRPGMTTSCFPKPHVPKGATYSGSVREKRPVVSPLPKSRSTPRHGGSSNTIDRCAGSKREPKCDPVGHD